VVSEIGKGFFERGSISVENVRIAVVWSRGPQYTRRRSIGVVIARSGRNP